MPSTYFDGPEPSVFARLAGDALYAGTKKYLRGSKSQRYFANKKGPSPYRTRIIRPSYQKKTSYVGRPIGRGTSKRSVLVTSSNKVMATRTLYSRDISKIPRTLTGAPIRIDGRTRELVNFRGVKIDISAINAATVLSSPIVLHWAVVHDKGRANPGLFDNEPLQVENFFRGDKGNRGIDFIDERSGAEINTNSINSDLYVTLKRGKKILQPRASLTGLLPSCSTMISEYIPINRQLTYDDTLTPYATDGRLFLTYWCERLQGSGSNSLPAASAVFLDKHVVAYFDEPDAY